MDEYEYHGPVYEFDELVAERWFGVTRAVSERKARSNLAYQYKKEHNKAADSRIKLTGRLILVEEGE